MQRHKQGDRYLRSLFVVGAFDRIWPDTRYVASLMAPTPRLRTLENSNSNCNPRGRSGLETKTYLSHRGSF
jgi:hypothetical protein